MYDNSVKVYRDYLVTMDAAKREGRAEGITEGRKEGITEGRELAQIEIARNLKAKGLDPAFIAETTSLGLEEIQKL